MEEARTTIGQVVEGYYAAKAVRLVAATLKVEMPIVEQIYRIIYEGMAPRQAVAALMNRPLVAE